MESGKHRQMSESFLLGALLALVGGFLDAYTYLLRGKVFANAQTGNIVLLGLEMANGNFTKALYYLIPISAFALGIITAEMVKRRFQQHPRIHWRQITIAVEFLLLLGVAFLPQGRLDVVANVTISFVCAMQVESFRKVNGNAYATTMCTGNLRSGTELLYLYRVTGDPQKGRKCAQYYGIILLFIAGAAVGVWVTRLLAERAVLICCVILGACFGAMFIREDIPEIADYLEGKK